MHNIEVPEANITFQFPESALEFTREQTILFARLLLLYQSNQITFKQLQIHTTYHFLNLKRRADFTKAENNQVAENIYQISQFVKDYFNEVRENGETKHEVILDFHGQKVSDITIDNITFYGPNEALFNTVYGEYLQLLNHFTTFNNTCWSSSHLEVGTQGNVFRHIYSPEIDVLNIAIQTVYLDILDQYRDLLTALDIDMVEVCTTEVLTAFDEVFGAY